MIKKQDVMDNIANEVATLGYEVDTTDGVKIIKDKGWAIILPIKNRTNFQMFL